MVYLRDQDQREEWHSRARQVGMSLSPWIVQTIEDLVVRGPPSEMDSKEKAKLLAEIDDLQAAVVDLKETVEDKRARIKDLKQQVEILENREWDKQADAKREVRNLNVDLLGLLAIAKRKGTSLRLSYVKRVLGLDAAAALDQLSAIRDDLKCIEETPNGWRWKQ